MTDAEGSTSGNGHSYFRWRPLVSSDILMSLSNDLTPEDRGLLRGEGLPVYTFPSDFIDKLRSTLVRLNRALKMEP